jgi:hypothetical protein
MMPLDRTMLEPDEPDEPDGGPPSLVRGRPPAGGLWVAVALAALQ